MGASPILDKMEKDAGNDDYKDREVISVTDARNSDSPDWDVVKAMLGKLGGVSSDRHEQMNEGALIVPDTVLGRVFGKIAEMGSAIVGSVTKIFTNEDEAMQWAHG